MDLKTEKLELIRQLTAIEDIQLIQAIKQLIATNKDSPTLDDYNKDLSDAEKGDFISNTDVKNQMKSW